MRFTDSYGEQSCTAGRASFITGQSVFRTGLSKVGMPGADVGLQAEDVTIAQLLKPLGLRDRAVRQEPPRRPQQVPADRPRLRRVLRQPLPPQRRGGARVAQLAAGRRTSRASTSASGRAASCAPGRPTPTIRPRTAATGRVGRQRIEDTGPLTKKRMETIDDETVAAADGLHPAPARRRHALLRVDEHHAHAPAHAPEAREPRAGRALAVALPRHDDRPRPPRRPAARPARRARARRGHDRRLQHRQRPAHEHVARRRHDPVPQREEHELGRRVPRPAR